MHCSPRTLATALFDQSGQFLTTYYGRVNNTSSDGEGGGNVFSTLPAPLLLHEFSPDNVVVLRYKKISETLIAELLQQIILVETKVDGREEFGLVFSDFDIDSFPCPAYDNRKETHIPGHISVILGS